MNHVLASHPQYAGFGSAMYPPSVSLVQNSEDRTVIMRI